MVQFGSSTCAAPLSTVSVSDVAEARSSKKPDLYKSSDLMNLDRAKATFLIHARVVTCCRALAST
jgi:hypothetical protein